MRSHFVDPVNGIDMTVSELAAMIPADAALEQPHIDTCSWGKTISTYLGKQTVTGGKGQRGDVVLLPDREAVPWNWAWQTPVMNHDGSEGGRLLNLDDIRHYIVEPCQGNIPSVIILTMGRGYQDLENDPGVLKIQSSLPDQIEESFGVKVLVLKTQKAVPKYNDLVAKGISVAAMIHTTC